MPARILSKPDMLARLMDLFRDKGFDGASLAAISESTGLGKSSLYHHFPNGKEEMAHEVLAYLDAQLAAAVFDPLRGAGTPRKKLDRMLDAIDRFYEGGKKACLLERLCASVDAPRFRRPLGQAFTTWIEAVEALGIEAGVPRATARRRAEDLGCASRARSWCAPARAAPPSSPARSAICARASWRRCDRQADAGPASDANRTFACGRSFTRSWKMSGRA